MSFRVHILPSADSDMDEAYLWWAKHRSREQAARWHRELMAALRTLTEDALIHPLCEESDLREGKLHQLLFGLGRSVTHRVVYSVDEQTVSVMRVRHTGRES